MFGLASQKGLILLGFFGGPLETRTPDPLIKGHLVLSRVEQSTTRSIPGLEGTGLLRRRSLMQRYGRYFLLFVFFAHAADP
jgi:hypothetical protein